MADKNFEEFLRKQYDEGLALANASVLLRLTPLDGPLPQNYIAEFRCTGLVLVHGGVVREANLFHVGTYFPPDYLRRADPAEVLTWLGPATIFHPNVRCTDQSKLVRSISIGRFAPGTSLVDLVTHCFDIITYNKFMMGDREVLNRAAWEWARHNSSSFPVDGRPLQRRRLD